MIEQNLPVHGDGEVGQAVIERMVKLDFKYRGHTEESREAFNTLSHWDMNSLSGFLFRAITQESQILEKYKDRLKHHENLLIKDFAGLKARIIKNYAQIRALVECLALVLPIPKEYSHAALDSLLLLARER